MEYDSVFNIDETQLTIDQSNVKFLALLLTIQHIEKEYIALLKLNNCKSS